MSRECCTTSIYYEPARSSWASDGTSWATESTPASFPDGSWFAEPAWLLIIFLIVVIGIILLAFLPKTDKPPKSLSDAKKEIAKAFDDLTESAGRLNRPETAVTLGEARKRVDGALNDVKKI